MIVRMKKLTLLCMAEHQDATLNTLRDLGVVHLSHIQQPKGQDLEEARHHLAHVQRAADTLPHRLHAKPTGRPAPEIVDDIWAFIREKKRLTEERDALVQERLRIEPFGSFDPSAIEKLAGEGVLVRLFKGSAKSPLPRPDNTIVQEMHRDKSHVWYALIGRSDVSVDAEAVRLPTQSLAELDNAIEEYTRLLAENVKRLEAHSHDYDVVATYLQSVEDQVSYVEALSGMGGEQAVGYLRGFCPEDAVPGVREAAAANGWGILVEDPGGSDPVPTLIKNPRWVSLIKPIMDFVGILPGYKEVDISPLFLVFFSVFFGMIVGDAGYGALFLVMSLLGRKLWPKAPRIIFSMLTLMSLCTIAWGALTGSYFGMAPAVLPAPLQGIPALSNGNPGSADNIMLICFLIGAVHLTIAHGWNVVRKMPSVEAIGDLGWLMSTWVMFFAARTMILLQPFPQVMLWVLSVAAVFIIISLIFPLSRLKEQGINLITLPLDLVSNFVDVVSYVRLFAVGMATFAVASAFNEMALKIGFGNVFSGLGSAMIMFFGHILNIALAVMGVLVHGIRLNTLEFSGHLGMEWTGVAYRPFERKAVSAGADKGIEE
jgi:V/A-type H+-transporting ATPase subunit I